MQPVMQPTVHSVSVHQAVKLVAALLVLRVARVTAGLAESNGSLPPGQWRSQRGGKRGSFPPMGVRKDR